MIAPVQAWQGSEYLPDLLIEASRLNGLVEITQSTGAGEHSAIEIAPAQVLYIAQKLGMVRELTGDEAAARERLESQVFQLERDQRRLRHALLSLRDRSEQLHRNITAQQGRGHEDLTTEMVQAGAMADILDLVCADFEDEFAAPDDDDGRPIYPPTTAQQDAARLRSMKPAPAAQAANPQAARASVTVTQSPRAPGLFDVGDAP